MRHWVSFFGLTTLIVALCAWSAPLRAQDSPLHPLPFTVDLTSASPIELYDEELETSDSNTPVEWANGRVYVFVSHWLPIGHSYRRSGSSLKKLEAGAIQIEITGDKTPGVGKWLEATYRDKDGTLYGWYHAETDGPCGRQDRKVPLIGAMVSKNGGVRWTDLGAIIEAPQADFNCDMQNGFFAGGLGDFSVILDRQKQYFYFYFSNYDSHLHQQGIAAARMPYAARDNPVGHVLKWDAGAWTNPGLGGHTTPIFPALRNFKHPDPDSFWGPAIHFNTYLNGYVMLLNRTAEGESDWFQEGIYMAFADRLSDPSHWYVPQKIMDGGDWYPQVIGMGQGETDKLSGQSSRFFMSGYSVWNIEFKKQASGATGSVTTDKDIDVQRR